MIYALTDPRKDRQEIYIGKTNNKKLRLNAHIKDGEFETESFKRIHTNKISSKNIWMKSILDDNLEPSLVIIDENEIYSESDWIKTFAEHNFILTNSKNDINNCLSGYGLTGESCKSVPQNTFNNIIAHLKSLGFYEHLFSKINVCQVESNNYFIGEWTYDYYTYPTKNLNPIEEIKFIEEYSLLLKELEFGNYAHDTTIIFDKELYILNSEAKKSFVRDYFNNDLLASVINRIPYLEDETYCIEDIESLINNGYEPNSNHLNTLKKYLDKKYISSDILNILNSNRKRKLK